MLLYFFRRLFSPHSKAKANYKSTISGKLVTSGISDVATASVHSEKTRAKKLNKIGNHTGLSAIWKKIARQ